MMPELLGRGREIRPRSLSLWGAADVSQTVGEGNFCKGFVYIQSSCGLAGPRDVWALARFVLVSCVGLWNFLSFPSALPLLGRMCE